MKVVNLQAGWSCQAITQIVTRMHGRKIYQANSSDPELSKLFLVPIIALFAFVLPQAA